MTAIKAEPSRESILEEIEINQRIGADHRFSEKEWSVIIAALRAPAGEPVAPNNGESLITVKIPESYASTWDFLNDCGLEAVYPTAPAGDGSQCVSPGIVDAAAQALADDVRHPPLKLENMARHEATKFKRQAQLMLDAIGVAQVNHPIAREWRCYCLKSPMDCDPNCPKKEQQAK